MSDAERKLRRARTGLLLEHPFFGSLCLRMSPRPDPHCATAWTDGRTLAYNPVYVAGLRDEQVRGLLAHTVMHPACQHHVRRKGRDRGLWNAACDHAINWILLDAGLDLPPKYLDNPAYHGLSADEIYVELHASHGEEFRPTPSDSEGETGGAVDWDGPEGAAIKGERTGAEDETGPGGGEGGGEDGASDVSGGEGSSGAADRDRYGDPGGSGEVRDAADEVEGGGPPEGESDEFWELALAEAARQARDVGDMPGALERLVGEILSPRLDWRELLDRYLGERASDDYGWTPPNRRFLHLGLILPSLSSRRLPDVVLGIDTSGSVTPAEVDRFAAELSGLLEAYDTTVHVAFCDCSLTGSASFGRADLPLDLEPAGGGGTDYRPVFEWVEREGVDPACLVYLTDLECQLFPERAPGYPVLWARVGGGGRVPPFGDIIDIP